MAEEDSAGEANVPVNHQRQGRSLDKYLAYSTCAVEMLWFSRRRNNRLAFGGSSSKLWMDSGLVSSKGFIPGFTRHLFEQVVFLCVPSFPIITGVRQIATRLSHFRRIVRGG